MKKSLLILLLLAWSSQVFGDDIDLYIDNTISASQRPNVLIILDNSPSMDWYIVGSNTYVDGGSGNRHVNYEQTRAHKAREIVIDLINDNPEVDFALQIFNRQGNGRQGGRIVSGFKDLSLLANKEALIKILDTDTDNTNNNYTTLSGSYTPLCETLYETYRYLSGGQLYHGNDDTYIPRSIITNGSYTSPFLNIECNKEINIIYITDGDPTGDSFSDGDVKALTGASDSDAEPSTNNFLGVLGGWMARKNWAAPDPDDTFKDIDNTSKSSLLASVKIHTVAFGGGVSAENLLKLAARDGEVEVPKQGYHSMPAGGKYYPATTAAALKEALDSVIAEVLDISTLTSASVSANSFDRTQTLDSVYYGMFEPSTAARWQGNIKKYKVVNGEQVDALGAPAVDSTGEFSEDSKSFWSADVDGNDVTEGGVAEMLRATTITLGVVNRKLLTDVGVTPSSTATLPVFTTVADITDKYADNAALIVPFGIPIDEVGDVSDHIKWAMGINVDNDKNADNTIPVIRPDVFGDPLHSKPVVINYGVGNPRIVVGTNSGVLHMFEDDSGTNTVKESWAYLPSEFFKNIKPLRENNIGVGNKIYGLDGEITLHINDSDKNGKVDGSDTAWLFFGVRRGGRSYYAIDVTSPDAPKLMWHITAPEDGSGQFGELGLTFSKPQVVKSAFNTTVGDDNLVVIFGGGYDTKKDGAGANTHDDDNGATVFMVNAKTGAYIDDFPTGKNNGIASSVASLDSDSDGLVDRLYVGDTGGNVLRVDMPDADPDHTSIITLATLGGSTDLDDRRFFNPPTIVRTYILESIDIGTEDSPHVIKQEIPYDAILLGSGDRATPTSTDTDDMFFMIKDKYIKTQQFGSSPATAVPTAITLDTLYDYTDDPFKGYPLLSSAQELELITASGMSGWYFDLQELGEKNTAKAIVINSVVYFTSYAPSAAATCSVVPGNSWLYAMDLAQGIKKYNWSSEDNSRGDDDRIKHINNQFLGAPTLISTPVTDPDTNVTDIQGNLIVGKEVIPVGFTLQTIRTSLTIPEN